MMRNSNSSEEGYVEEEDLFKENLSTFQNAKVCLIKNKMKINK